MSSDTSGKIPDENNPPSSPCNFRVQQEMNHRCHEVKYKTFISFAKVSALEDKIPRRFKKALKKNKISKFDDLVNCIEETQMYEHLVCLTYSTVTNRPLMCRW